VPQLRVQRWGSPLLGAGGVNVPPGTKPCWGCMDPLPEESTSDYCEVCEISLQLIRKLQDDGSRVLWTIPELRASRPRI
jgi:hypothetical protein